MNNQFFQENDYEFSRIFNENATQQDVFNQVAKPVVDYALAGYNGAIIAYGQTSSGKTYTMEGKIGKSFDCTELAITTDYYVLHR